MPLNLPRLPRNVKLTDANGQPTQIFQQWWQSAAKAIEAQFGAVDAAIAAQAAADNANAAAVLAQAAADDATTAATNAQTTADTITAENGLINSYMDPAAVLSATDAGASATIVIGGHDRVYGDATPTVAITGASITGLAYSTLYYIYYDDATRADTTPTFTTTTDAATAAQTGNRHTVGSVTTPAAAAPDTDGGGVYPPGVGDIR